MTVREYRDVFNAARSFSRRTKQPLIGLISKAVRKYLDYEQTLRCLDCGSTDIEFVAERSETGVVAPDGGREYQEEQGMLCHRCGSHADLHDFDARFGS